MGFDVVPVNGQRTIVINKTGKQLKKAFKWKVRGHKNDEIITRLKSLGVTINKQKLSMIFSNPLLLWYHFQQDAKRKIGQRHTPVSWIGSGLFGSQRNPSLD